MEKKKLFVVCSSHLDREWYVSYEQTRIYIDGVINRVLDILARQPDYRFMLDGQTSVLEDYLEIYPEREEEIARFVQEGRLLIGPWYIQPDECLPIGESIARNLLLGEKISRRYGEPMKVGYVPDAFGHISQLPQIFTQFGIHNAFMSRGCPPGTARDFIWKGADGSELTGMYYPYGACTIMDGAHMRKGIRLVENAQEFQDKIKEAENMAGYQPVAPFTLLTFNGDMLPPPEDPAALGVPSYDNLSDCFALSAQYRDQFQTLEGELRESPDIVYNLQDTLVSRVYLKLENQRAQDSLIRFAEPLNALAFGATKKYPAGFLAKSWKYLLENHTHDGICGCSGNDVCSEMMTRFQKSRNISDTYARVALEALAAQTDTRFAAAENDYGTLVVFNPQPFAADEPVCVEFVYPSSEAPEAFRVTDSDGHACPCQITAARDREFIRSDFKSVQHFAKDRVFQAVLQAGPLPAFGIKAFRLEKAAANENAPEDALLVSKESRTVENAYITLSVADNGTLTLTDKATGYVYRDLNYFIEEGDGGDAYIFNQIPGGSVHDSRSLRWDIEFLQDGPLQAACRLKAEWELPFEMTGHAAGRSAQVVKNSLEYLVHVYAGSPVVRIQLHVDNRSKDHRIRAYFPTSIQSDHVWADGQFSLEKRTGSRLHGTMPQQTFCAVSGEQRGLAILEKGLHQYDYLDDGNGTLALSIIRGQGALYRGFFERYNDEYSETQCLGGFDMEYAIYPFATQGGALPDIVLQKAAQFNTGLRSTQTGSHEGRIPACQSFLALEEGGLQLSSFKLSEDGSRIVARFYNPRAISVQARLALALPVDSAVRMNMHEDVLAALPVTDGRLAFEAGPCEIVTLGFDGVFSPLER